VRSAAQIREHYEIECELADRLRNAPSVEERRRLYGVVYEERSRRIAHHPLVERAGDEETRVRAADPQVRLLRSFASPSMRFAEIGAGDGAVAHGVAPFVRDATAVDVTDVLAITDDPSIGFSFIVFDGFDLPLREIDLAYSNDVAEHLHPDDFLDHARTVLRALKPRGHYVCVTPNRLSGPHDISRHFDEVPRGFHLREYTSSELGAALKAAGFSDVKIVGSFHGRRVSPLLPLAVIRPFERLVERLPSGLRVRLAPGLSLVKVVAIK
jgi:SAM-dependent methyltransferase